MGAGDLYLRWQDRIEIIKHEAYHLFASRKQFRDLTFFFHENPRLNEIGGDVYQWLLGMWAHDALMGIRRELDDQTNTVNLRQMLYEMKDRPEVLTRRRYLAFLQPGDSDWLVESLNHQFDERGYVKAHTEDSLDDYLDPVVINADRETLEQGTQAAFAYAQQMVAHRTPVDTIEIKIAEIHSAIDAIEPMLQKYYCILKCVSIGTATPTFQYDWTAPFKFAWYVPSKINLID